MERGKGRERWREEQVTQMEEVEERWEDRNGGMMMMKRHETSQARKNPRKEDVDKGGQRKT